MPPPRDETTRVAGTGRVALRSRWFVAVALLLTVIACRSSQQQPAFNSAGDRVLPHQTFTIDSKILGETRRINVWTPPHCAKCTLPVLYMPDGGVEEDFPHVTNDVDAAIRVGEMRQMIVVGIENTERRRDMTGPTSVEADKKIATHVGGSAPFRAFIRDELMPEIVKRYRVSDETAIVGESLAGLFVVETFFQEPEMFDTYVALSPSLWWNDQAIVRAASEKLKSRTWPNVTFYLASAGDDDIGDACRKLGDIFYETKPMGVRSIYDPRPNLKHSNIYRGASPRIFRDLFPPTQRQDRR